MLYACRGEGVRIPPPDDLLPQDSMKILITEMMLTANAIEVRFQHLPKFYKVSKSSGEAILDKYGVSKDRYFKSLTYYQANLNELERMYQDILDSLNHLN